MAAPRVFISSTFYDLRQIRADLELFIREMGYEPVLHERGAVSYGSTDKLEEYAYREVTLSDLLVSIVGGRFGTESQHGGRSISQEELKRALDAGTQVYIFVEQSLHTEYQTYLGNKGKDISWRFVDDVRVYEYLEGLYALPNNNTIQSFETAADITAFLKRQWAGLFHRFLQEQGSLREHQSLEQLQSTIRTLDRLVTVLADKDQSVTDALEEIVRPNHPLFARLRAVLGVSYPIFLQTLEELDGWLRQAARFKDVKETAWDDDEHREWVRGDRYLRVYLGLFDDQGKLKPLKADDWQEDWVELKPVPEWELDDPLDDGSDTRVRFPMTRVRAETPFFEPPSVAELLDPDKPVAPDAPRRTAPRRRASPPPAGGSEAGGKTPQPRRTVRRRQPPAGEGDDAQQT